MLSRVKIVIMIMFMSVMGCISCATVPVAEKDSRETAINEFLKVKPEVEEVFRVYLSSGRYLVSQMKYLDRIKRGADPGGDKFICEELKKHDKIDETRDGIVTVWLFPDSGRLMKIRPKKLTYLMEIDALMVEDIQRWNFKFTGNFIYPTKFDVMYRVAIRKKQSDEEIIKEVQDKLKEKSRN